MYSMMHLQQLRLMNDLEYTNVFQAGVEFEKHVSVTVDFVVGYSLFVVDIAVWSDLAGTGQR